MDNKTLIPLSSKEAMELLLVDSVLLDIRPEYETSFRVFDVPRVLYLPYSSYHEDYQCIPKEKYLIVADSVGNQCGEVARFLLSNGYERIAYLVGGIVAWDRNGLPLKKDADYQMVGGCACRLHPQKAKEDGSSVVPK